MSHRRTRAALAAALWLAACGGGTKVSVPDPCAAAGVCSTPPADACPSAASALHYPQRGTCTAVAGAASCDYRPALADCAAAGQVCQAGACVAPPDPCAASGVCRSPPASGCSSATAAVTYPAVGTCTAAGTLPSCSYAPTTVDCAAAGQVCQAGTCVAPDPCAAGGVCTTPPPATCASATQALTYPATGTCSSATGPAVCDYPPTAVDCAATGQVCQAGACAAPPDPCGAAGVCSTPPADACVSAATLLRYPNPGACTASGAAASCDYPPAQVDCGAAGKVCRGGACVADPCAIPLDGAGFLAYAASAGGASGYDLRAVRLDGTCDQLLAAAAGDDLGPSWRAAAGRLAWGGVRGGLARIVVMDLADRVQRVVDTGADFAFSPALSPDGQAVTYENLVSGQVNAHLRSIPVAGGTSTQLHPTSTDLEAGPAFSGDGAKLYFVSDRYVPPISVGPHHLGIWRGPVAGGTAELVTTSDALLGKPALSADGKWLVYARSNPSGSASLSRIVRRDLDTGAECVLSNQGDSEPALPASGDVVAVRTSRYGLTDIVLLGLDATDCTNGNAAVVKRLTDGTHLVGTPAFPR